MGSREMDGEVPGGSTGPGILQLCVCQGEHWTK